MFLGRVWWWSGGGRGDTVPPHGDLKQKDGHKFEVSFVNTQFQARLSDRMRRFLRKKNRIKTNNKHMAKGWRGSSAVKVLVALGED